jgi:hypothetical protein
LTQYYTEFNQQCFQNTLLDFSVLLWLFPLGSLNISPTSVDSNASVALGNYRTVSLILHKKEARIYTVYCNNSYEGLVTSSNQPICNFGSLADNDGLKVKAIKEPMALWDTCFFLWQIYRKINQDSSGIKISAFSQSGAPSRTRITVTESNPRKIVISFV